MISRSYNTEPLTFQQVKEILKLEYELEKDLIRWQRDHSPHPNADTHEIKEIKRSAKQLENYYKEQLGLDKRRTHDPANRIAFILFSGDRPVTGDNTLDKEIKLRLSQIPLDRPEVIYSVYSVYLKLIGGDPEKKEILERICVPHMKKVLTEKENWTAWNIFPQLPVGKIWMKWDPDVYTEEILDKLNALIKTNYETVYLKALAGAGPNLGRSNSMLAIASIVAKTVYEESIGQQEKPASTLNELKSEAYSVVQEQKIYDREHILPIMEVHYHYGLLQ